MTIAPAIVASTTAIAVLLTLAGCYNEAADFRRLTAAPAASEGRMVYVDGGSHGLVVYAFAVDGRAYRGKAAGLDCRRVKPGDRMTVFHDPAHPSTNTARQPNDAHEAASGWSVAEWVFALVVLPLLIGAGFVAQAVLAKRRSPPGGR